MADDKKMIRKNRKSALTREVNVVKRLIAEDDVEEVKQRLQNLKPKFLEFEKAHEDYHTGLTVDAEINASDQYFDEVLESYTNAVTSIKSWLRDQTSVAEANKI